MRCEMCGKETPTPVRALVERSTLVVCPACVKFGKTLGPVAVPRPAAHAARSPAPGVARQPAAAAAEDAVFEEGPALAEDFGTRLRRAREQLGLTQEQLGAKINERQSVVAKLETGAFTPDDPLRRKLERTLGVTLVEKQA